MNDMTRLKIGVLALVVVMLTGCSSTILNRNIHNTTEKPDTIEQTTDASIDEGTNLDNEGTENNGNTDANSEDRQPIPDTPAPMLPPDETEPAPGPQVEPDSPNIKKLDISILDSLDNKKFGWGLKLIGNGQPPEVPSSTKKILEEHNGIYIGDTTEKVVYLTIDEGYENGYTPKILDTLKENDVKALFFVTGPYIKKNSELVERMINEGHEVGNHTINHPSLPDVDNAKLEKELLGLDEEFYSKFEKRFRYMRPPMGEYSERVLEASSQLGYKTVFWSFAYRDFDVNDQKGADYAYKKVMDNLHNGAVLLLHAVSKDNAEALDRIIKGITEAGYTIKPFDF